MEALQRSFEALAPSSDENAYDFVDSHITPVTVELDLGALGLEFDKQLTNAIDNLFGDEFAGLHCLEAFTTTTTTAFVSDYKGKGKEVSANLEEIGQPNDGAHKSRGSSDTPLNSAGSTSVCLDEDGVIVRSTKKSAPPPVPSASVSLDEDGVILRSTQNPAPPPLSSGTVCLDEDGVILRSTQNPAPPPLSSADPPTSRTLESAAEKPITRSTNVGAVQSVPFAESFLQGSRPLIHDRSLELITRSTQPPQLHRFIPHQAVSSFAVPITPAGFARNEVPKTGEAFSLSNSTTSHKSLLSPSTTAFQTSTPAIDEDVEMPFSDSCFPSTVSPGGSFQLFQNHDLVFSGNRLPQNPPTLWTARNQRLFGTPCDGSPSTSGAASYSESWSDFNNPVSGFMPAHLQFPPPGLPPPPHPSIFELIQIDTPHPTTTPYIIPAANVPTHVWQQEITREQRTLEKPGKRAKPSRIPAPYFSRTPLVSMTNKRRGKKATTGRFSSIGALSINHDPPPQKYDDLWIDPPTRQGDFLYPMQRYDRSSSPTPSCSSGTSSTSGVSSSVTSRAYGRQLSSPPPFRQRHQRFNTTTREHRGVLGALNAISWLWS
ncbi:hypothetical protein C8F04DRAFT_1099476 [Mycena alexandri]|uniref:Uncharacterized protein n=1 Tax=Mycena alexandri TaxID=1745969 RepID=A0AAD6WQ57_9AGAR|nr:hypothetical protein C8F04DRAFT_1135471 [Mycena alexandri]KAJ7035227.1 hypothetical protein C8F04DRAFT_1099476 [Mycena alexandri]